MTLKQTRLHAAERCDRCVTRGSSRGTQVGLLDLGVDLSARRECMSIPPGTMHRWLLYVPSMLELPSGNKQPQIN